MRRAPGSTAPSRLSTSDGLGPGAGFAAATILLASLAVAITLDPESECPLVAAVVLFGGLLVGYALAATIGLPVLHPTPEPVDGLALATKAVEAVGLLAAAGLLLRPALVTHPRLKGTLT